MPKKIQQVNKKMLYPTDWNLTELYTGITDPKLASDLQRIQADAIAFEKKHHGKISGYSDTKIRQLLEQFNDISLRIGILIVYLDLSQRLNSKDQKINTVLQNASITLTDSQNHFIFLELELGEHPKLAEYAQSKKLEPYNIVLFDVLKQKKYKLSHAEERVMNMQSVTAHEGWIKLFDQVSSQKIYDITLDNKKKVLTQEQILKLLYKEDASARKQAAFAFSTALAETKQFDATLYNMIMVNHLQTMKLRSLEKPELSRHLNNNVDSQIVDTLERVVTKNYSLVSRYYNFKRKTLKLKKLLFYDRYAPIQIEHLLKHGKTKERKYTFKQAVQIVKNAYTEFDPEFREIMERIIDRGHIDVYPKQGKVNGAFCCTIGNPYLPYILLNFVNTYRDVETLAHEMGHAIHGVLTMNLPPLVAGEPLVLAETASVFGEMIIFDKLFASLKTREEKIIALSDKIEEYIATIFRQIAMYVFEKKAHGHVKEHGEASPDALHAMWLQTQKEMFQESVVLDDAYGDWWSYISHFYHTPFYVYAYAFGSLSVLSLYKKYKDGMPNFVETYKKFLSFGGSKTPQEAVSIFGFDLTQEEFWQEGISVLSGMIDTLERL